MKQEIIKEQEEYKTIRYYNPISKSYFYITYIYNFDKLKVYINGIITKFSIKQYHIFNKTGRKPYIKVTYRKIHWNIRTQYFYNYNRISFIKFESLKKLLTMKK